MINARGEGEFSVFAANGKGPHLFSIAISLECIKININYDSGYILKREEGFKHDRIARVGLWGESVLIP